MLTHFLTLGLSGDATDEQIREAYLRMVKKHPPEKDPEHFRKVNDAYEALKDRRGRIHTAIYAPLLQGDYEQGLIEFSNARQVVRRRATLGELLQACQELRRQNG